MLRKIELPGFGEHQLANACLAIAAIQEFTTGDTDKESDPDNVASTRLAIRDGIRNTVLQGRLEVVSEEPFIIADMAHNEASVKAMVHSLGYLSPPKLRQAIFSCSKDKDYRAMLCELVPFFDRIILTEFQSNPRSCPLALIEEETQVTRCGKTVDRNPLGHPT